MGESRIKAMPGHRLARQGNVVLLPNAGQPKVVNPVRRGRKPGCLSFAAGQRRKVAANLRQQAAAEIVSALEQTAPISRAYAIASTVGFFRGLLGVDPATARAMATQAITLLPSAPVGAAADTAPWEGRT